VASFVLLIEALESPRAGTPDYPPLLRKERTSGGGFRNSMHTTFAVTRTKHSIVFESSSGQGPVRGGLQILNDSEPIADRFCAACRFEKPEVSTVITPLSA
jgi:hypothetical protein